MMPTRIGSLVVMPRILFGPAAEVRDARDRAEEGEDRPQAPGGSRRRPVLARMSGGGLDDPTRLGIAELRDEIVARRLHGLPWRCEIRLEPEVLLEDLAGDHDGLDVGHIRGAHD